MYLSQASVNVHGEWVFAAEHAPGGPYRVLERRDGLAEIGIVERHGGAVFVERPRVIPPQPERLFITLSENAPRHEHRFAQQ